MGTKLPTVIVCTAVLLAFAASTAKAQVCGTCGPEYGEDDFDEYVDDYDYWRSKRGVFEMNAAPPDVVAAEEEEEAGGEHIREKRSFLSCEDCKARCICKGTFGAKGKARKPKVPQCLKALKCKCKKGKRKSKKGGNPNICD